VDATQTLWYWQHHRILSGDQGSKLDSPLMHSYTFAIGLVATGEADDVEASSGVTSCVVVAAAFVDVVVEVPVEVGGLKVNVGGNDVIVAGEVVGTVAVVVVMVVAIVLVVVVGNAVDVEVFVSGNVVDVAGFSSQSKIWSESEPKQSQSWRAVPSSVL